MKVSEIKATHLGKICSFENIKARVVELPTPDEHIFNIVLIPINEKVSLVPINEKGGEEDGREDFE